MDGEVVMPRQRHLAPTVQHHHQRQHRIPDHVLTAVDVEGTPIRDNLSGSRGQQFMGPDHPRSRTVPSFPRLGQRHPSDHSLSHSSTGG
jgi:hypothetical protein